MNWIRSWISAGIILTTCLVLADEDPQYSALLEIDDAAWKKAERLILEAEAFSEAGSELLKENLKTRLETLFDEVDQTYRVFLTKYPERVKARIAYASFLKDIQKIAAAEMQLKRAGKTHPENPVVYNNLADLYAREGQQKKAFDLYLKAHELKQTEPLYLRNLANLTAVFPNDAAEHFKISDEEVKLRCRTWFQKAIALNPKDFGLISLSAKSHESFTPYDTKTAMADWSRAKKIATTDHQRQAVTLHQAKIRIHEHRMKEALDLLNQVTLRVHQRQREILIGKTTILENADAAR